MREWILYLTVLVTCIHESQVLCILQRPTGPVGPVNRRRPIGRSCSSSSDCRKGYTRFPSCCRDSSGELIDADKGWDGHILSDPSKGSTCSMRKGGPGEYCNDICGCIRGYECYRPLTGVCCAPSTCWKKEDAKKDKDQWKNCNPPNCFLPP